LVWFSHNNENFEVIKCKDRSKYIQKILFKHSIM
jgi:hypothetical protein